MDTGSKSRALRRQASILGCGATARAIDIFARICLKCRGRCEPLGSSTAMVRIACQPAANATRQTCALTTATSGARVTNCRSAQQHKEAKKAKGARIRMKRQCWRVGVGLLAAQQTGPAGRRPAPPPALASGKGALLLLVLSGRCCKRGRLPCPPPEPRGVQGPRLLRGG